MIENELAEIEARIGRYEEKTEIWHEGMRIINPNADLQRLVNEVRLLQAERRHYDRIATENKRLTREIEGGTSDDGIPEQGWKGLVAALKARVMELEAERE